MTNRAIKRRSNSVIIRHRAHLIIVVEPRRAVVVVFVALVCGCCWVIDRSASTRLIAFQPALFIFHRHPRVGLRGGWLQCLAEIIIRNNNRTNGVGPGSRRTVNRPRWVTFLTRSVPLTWCMCVHVKSCIPTKALR